MSEAPEIDQAATALRRGRPGVALEKLLALWRERPGTGLAGMIVRVGRLASVGQPPLSRGSSESHHADWMARVGTTDAAGLGQLLDELDGLDYVMWLLPERLQALGAIPRDPRTTIALRRLIKRRRTKTLEFWEAALELVTHLRDPGWPDIGRLASHVRSTAPTVPLPNLHSGGARTRAAYERMQAERARQEQRRAASLQALAGEWEARCQALSSLPSWQHAVRSIHEALAQAPRRSLGELWARVAEEPESLAPRYVLADALLERDDPRGELIQLQLAEAEGAASDADREAARNLAWSYGHEMIGELGQTLPLRSYALSAGVLHTVHLQATPTFKEPQWRTVEVLTGLACLKGELASLCRLPLLRRVTVAEDDLLALLALTDPPGALREIELGVLRLEPHLEAIRAAPILRQLRRIDAGRRTAASPSAMMGLLDVGPRRVSFFEMDCHFDVDLDARLLRLRIPKRIATSLLGLTETLSRMPAAIERAELLAWTDAHRRHAERLLSASGLATTLAPGG